MLSKKLSGANPGKLNLAFLLVELSGIEPPTS